MSSTGPALLGVLALFAAAFSLRSRGTDASSKTKIEKTKTIPSSTVSTMAAGAPIADPKDWVERVLNRVAKNEGRGGFNTQRLDNVGQGLSWAIIQWAQRPGSLHNLLTAMETRDPYAFLWIFGNGSEAQVDALLTGTTKQENWVVGGPLIAGYKLIQPYWTNRFTAAALHPKFQEVQIDQATLGEYFQSAVAISNMLQIDSERALAIFYDASVQHGALASRLAERVGEALTGAETPQEILKRFAQATWNNFYRAAAPTNTALGGGRTWRPVGNAWHMFGAPSRSNPTGLDLYLVVKKRREPMLTESGLSDVGVDWRVLQSDAMV